MQWVQWVSLGERGYVRSSRIFHSPGVSVGTSLDIRRTTWQTRPHAPSRNKLRCILGSADFMGPSYFSDIFRVHKNDEMREFGEYRTQRLVLAAWDALER